MKIQRNGVLHVPGFGCAQGVVQTLATWGAGGHGEGRAEGPAGRSQPAGPSLCRWPRIPGKALASKAEIPPPPSALFRRDLFHQPHSLVERGKPPTNWILGPWGSLSFLGLSFPTIKGGHCLDPGSSLAVAFWVTLPW